MTDEANPQPANARSEAANRGRRLSTSKRFKPKSRKTRDDMLRALADAENTRQPR